MSRAAVEQLLYLMDMAFDEGQWHSLLGNLRSVTADDWLWTPPGGARTIRLLTAHVAACKYVYDNHAFGDAAMSWNDPAGDLGYGMEDLQSESVLDNEPSIADVVAWLSEGHRRLREHVAALNDEELLRPRRTNKDEMKETRWIIAVMIEHDLYHAGEINHIRALRQRNDGWASEPA
jgi:hypothetical protein